MRAARLARRCAVRCAGGSGGEGRAWRARARSRRAGRLSMAALTTLMRRADARAGDAARTVFVAGATGATGREVVRQALAAGYTVRAGARDASSVERLPGVTPVAFDVVEDSDQQLVDGASTRWLVPRVCVSLSLRRLFSRRSRGTRGLSH